MERERDSDKTAIVREFADTKAKKSVF